MKANKIRFLAGGLAAVVLMSNMATNVVFAEELDTPVAVEESASTEESSSSEESAPAVEETPAPAEENVASEEQTVPEALPAPAEESVAPEEPVVPDTIPAPAPAEEYVAPEVPVAAEPIPAPAEESAAPEVPVEPEVTAETTVVEVGTAKAGNIEETSATEDVPVSDTPVSEDTPDGVDTEALEKGVQEQAERILEENAKRAADGEIGVAHAGDFEETTDPDAVPVEESQAEAAPTVEKRKEMNLKGPKLKNGERNPIRIVTEYYSNGEILQRQQNLDKDGNVVSETFYRLTNGTSQELETGDMSEMLVYAQLDRIEAEQKARAEEEDRQVNEILAQLGEPQSLNDVLNMVNTFSKYLKAAESYEQKEDPAAEEDGGAGQVEKYAAKTLKKAFENALDGAIKKIPGADFFGDTIKGMMMDMMGFPDDETDVASMIQSETERIENKMDEYQGESNRRREIVNALTSYGSEMDSFTDAATLIGKKIREFTKDVAEGTLTRTQMDVKVAALIGKISENMVGGDNIFSKMLSAAKSMLSESGKGPDTDLKNRNMFDLFYEYEREESLFSGEAMDKANHAIQSRVNRYINNCRLVLEALKAHERVVNLTSEEVEALDEDTRSTYSSVKSGAYDIKSFMKTVVGTITGDKSATDEADRNGIVDRASQYYSKDRLSFIDVNGKNICEIDLSDKLTTQKSENFDTSKLKKSPLNADQIKKITEKAKSLGMTPLQYLKFVGFDVSEIEKSNRNLYLETGSGAGSEGGSCMGGGYHKDYKYFKGYNMKNKGGNEEKKNYWSEEVSSCSWGTDRYTDNKDLMVYFQKK